MKVFISWSGEFSKKVAERLKTWIEVTIQSVNAFYSPNDIEKGENWSNRLSEELEQSNFGIVCLTPENVRAPWVHFEAGALSKVTDSRVSVIMLGVSTSDVKGPLARFQNTNCNREDFFHLLQSINSSSESPLKPETLKAAFDNSYGSFMSDIDAIVKDYTSRTPASKENDAAHEERDSDSDAIQEILRIVRNLDNGRTAPLPSPTPISTPEFNTSSSASPYDRVRILCPKEYFESVLPVIHKYQIKEAGIPFQLIEALLEKFEMCDLTIQTNQLSSLTSELHKISPKIRIEK